MEQCHQAKNYREFYKCLNTIYGPCQKSSHSINDKEGALLTTATEIEDQWVEHFSGLLNQPTLVDDKVLDDFQQLPIQHELSNPPMLRKVQAAIKPTKSGRSPGPDGIPPKIIIHGGHALGQNYTQSSQRYGKRSRF